MFISFCQIRAPKVSLLSALLLTARDNVFVQVVSRTLSTGTKTSDKPQAIIEYSIVAVEPSSDTNKLKMEEAVKEEHTVLATMSSASPLLETTDTAENKIASAVAVVETIPIPWSSLLSRIELFTRMMDKVAEVLLTSDIFFSFPDYDIQGSSVLPDGVGRSFRCPKGAILGPSAAFPILFLRFVIYTDCHRSEEPR
jgi:hypothetical protein